MEFKSTLIPGRLIKRYKRFLADVELDTGEQVTAHCANSGAMTGLKQPGLKVWLEAANNPKRKLQYDWQLVEADGGLVGINTSHPNRIAEEAIIAGKVAELTGYGSLRREVKYGRNSRIDILLEEGGKPSCYVEIKNVHLLRQPGLAEFPDAVTARGAKHLVELGDMVEQGHRAVMLYLVQRMDCDRFAVASDVDPTYVKQLEIARNRGVEAFCYDCHLTTTGIVLNKPLPLAM